MSWPLVGRDLNIGDLSSGRDLSSSSLRSRNLNGRDLRSGDLNGRDLSSSSLSSRDLRSGDLSGSGLRSGDLSSKIWINHQIIWHGFHLAGGFEYHEVTFFVFTIALDGRATF